jgi:hypothetical protein
MSVSLLSRPAAICSDMIATYQGLLAAVQGRREYAHSWADFGRTAAEMVSLEIPQLRADLEKLRALFEEVAQIHFELANAEERNAEDFRDVVERFAVLYRQTEAHSDDKRIYTAALVAVGNLTKARAEDSVKPPKLDGKGLSEEAAAKAVLRVARNRYAATLESLMHSRASYHALKVRRLRHGWLLYVEAMKKAAEKEMDVFARIGKALKALSLDGGMAQEIAARLAAPEPVGVAPEAISAVVDAAVTEGLGDPF